MSFDVKKQNDVTVIDVEGQLIVGNRQELKQKVMEELERGARKFLIDFSSTGYIDSSGLGVLVSLSKKIREQGGELRLAGWIIGYRLQVSPPPAMATFNDVPTGHPFFQFVEALAASGITAGCGAAPPLYCPDAPLTRGQMAVFLAKALGLHWPR